ncbi:glutamate synthase-related protein [Streptosporangium soli]|nr:glutamate synthase-related protein [Streptosporangium sp. KLBMP 9127]
MTSLSAPGFPEEQVRRRATEGRRAAFPALETYGHTLFGMRTAADPLDDVRLVPPVFTPERLAKLIELGREPQPEDVELTTVVGGLRSPLPAFLPAFGSTRAAGTDVGHAAGRQAGRLGIPMVIGENVFPVNGLGRIGGTHGSLLERVRHYTEHLPDDTGGIVVQQGTEDADAEVWNAVYTDPTMQPLLASGRLAFELKVGQGAKPGVGGMTLLDEDTARRVGEQYRVDRLDGDRVLRCGSAGTFTEEILRRQILLIRNNYPRCHVWVKLPPGRDVALAAGTAWQAGAEAVTVDGGEGGTGWAPTALLDEVGLPLGECLTRVGRPQGCLLVTGRMWEGARAVKSLALGARAVGLGRAALLAADEDPRDGLVRLVGCLAFELRLLISALGKYSAAAVSAEDVWVPRGTAAALDTSSNGHGAAVDSILSSTTSRR